ncbi:MAG: phage terminase large subunit [Candidatus Omnitrophica bacterium]|nr:phage terminase large subunit [Candidatus Omnitrophota bacterium]
MNNKLNNKLNNDARKLMRKAGEVSILSFAKLYLPHHLKINPSVAHKEIYEILSGITKDRGKRFAIAAPRDFGKSTMITLINIIYLICYEKEKFIVIISQTASQAQKILENIRKELTENELLRSAFPEIFEDIGRPKPPRWTQHDIITRNNIEILALGYNQTIRGRRHGLNRPTLVVLDDLEPDEGWGSYEATEKMKRWLNKSVFKVGNDKTNFLFIGTVHEAISVLGEYLNPDVHHNWIKRKYKALCELPGRMDLWQTFSKIQNLKELYKGQKGSSGASLFYEDHKILMCQGAVLLWEDKWSLYQLMEMLYDNEYSFMSEMQNDPYDLSEYSFDVDNFQYWDSQYLSVDALLDYLGNDVYFIAACDPAVGKSLFKGDYSSIVVLACKGNDVYVIVADLARRSPDKLTKDIIAYAKRYSFRKFVIENNNFQELVVQALEKSAREEKLTLNIERVNNHGNKISRIMSLYEWVKNGTIKFSKADKLLLDEFRFFPKANKHDDGLDALEMAFRFFKQCPGVQVERMLEMLEKFSGKNKAPKKIIGYRNNRTGKFEGIDDPFGLYSV